MTALPATRLDSVDWPRGRGAPHRQRLAGGFALVLGALVLWLAVPRLVASAFLAMRAPVVQAIDGGDEVAEDELLGLIASRELALGWVEDRATHGERGAALARLAFQEEPRSGAQRALLEGAVAAVQAGLAAAPAAPKDWMQLAYLLVLLEGDTGRKAAEALLVSVRTGPFQAPDFLLRRLFWLLAHQAFYDARERRRIDQQIRLVWEVAPGDLVDLARFVPEFAAPVAAALDARATRAQFVAALDHASPASGTGPFAPAEDFPPGAFDRPAWDHEVGAGGHIGGLADRAEE